MEGYHLFGFEAVDRICFGGDVREGEGRRERERKRERERERLLFAKGNFSPVRMNELYIYIKVEERG